MPEPRIDRTPQAAAALVPDCRRGRLEGHSMGEDDTVASVSLQLTQRIREEFEAAPWLRFTVDEAAQFWGLDLEVCRQVLASLIASGFLVSGADDRVAPQFASHHDCCQPGRAVANQLHG
jgi:hypothetical protein